MVKLTLSKWTTVTLAGSLLCLTALTGCQNGRPLLVAAPPGSHPTVTPTQTRIRPTPVIVPCTTCNSSSRWPELTTAPGLVAGLELAYDRYPPVRPLVDFAVSSGVGVVIAQPVDHDAIGDFDASSRVIRIAPSVLSEPRAVVASILVHEIVHVNEAYEVGAEACLAHEVVAYSWQAAVYESLRDGHESTPVARFEDELVLKWHSGRLDELVRGWPLYMRECFGKS